MTKTGNFTGQYWKLTPLDKDYSFGGNGGTEFPLEAVKSIAIRHGVNVDAIVVNGTKHGGSGGTATKTLELAAGEYINKIEVSSSLFVNYLKITTNKGNSIEGGKKDGKTETIGGEVLAIGGRQGNLLDQLKVRVFKP